MSMPVQKPGKSKQDYRTPSDFLNKLIKRLSIGDFACDLAADEYNFVGGRCYYTKEEDSLTKDWHTHGGWCFCNPPYADIKPWVAKAVEESMKGAEIAMLVPAAVGSNWWAEHVHDKAHVLFLNGRLSFDGKAPYPKDCALLLFTPYIRGGYEVWNWRE